MVTKTDQVRALVRQGEFKAALRIAKGFRIGIAVEHTRLMSLAYECMVHPDFYRSLKINTDEVADAGTRILVELFS